MYLCVYVCETFPLVNLNSMQHMEAEMWHTLMQGVGWVVNWGQSVAWHHASCNRRAEVPLKFVNKNKYIYIYIYKYLYIYIYVCIYAHTDIHSNAQAAQCLVLRQVGLKHACSHTDKSIVRVCITKLFYSPAEGGGRGGACNTNIG